MSDVVMCKQIIIRMYRIIVAAAPPYTLHDRTTAQWRGASHDTPPPRRGRARCTSVWSSGPNSAGDSASPARTAVPGHCRLCRSRVASRGTTRVAARAIPPQSVGRILYTFYPYSQAEETSGSIDP